MMHLLIPISPDGVGPNPQPNINNPRIVMVRRGVRTVREIRVPLKDSDSGNNLENMKKSGGTNPKRNRKPAVNHHAYRLPVSGSPIMKASTTQTIAEPNMKSETSIVHQGREPFILIGMSRIAATTLSLEM